MSNVTEAPLSTLVREQIARPSPIRQIMKMAERQNIVAMGLDPASVISFGGGWVNHAAPDAFASWSYDGSKIVFASWRGGTSNNDEEIVVMNADGSGLRRLTNSTATDQYPCYDATGARIAFQSDRDGNIEIYTMNGDGTGLSRVTSHTAVDVYPSWGGGGQTSGASALAGKALTGSSLSFSSAPILSAEPLDGTLRDLLR